MNPTAETPPLPRRPGPNPGGLDESALARLLRRAVLLPIFALSLVGAIRIAAMPTEVFVHNIMVDDAFYYVVPARNLLAGRGYSLDGQTRTNGVQPAWAAVALLLVALLPGNDTVLHGLVLLGGLMWIAAGVLLYRALRAVDSWAALLAAAGWLLTGFWNRLAFQGMENGLHGLLCGAILAVGMRHLRSPTERTTDLDRPAFYLKLGLLLALLTLARVDSSPLAVLIGVLVLAGLVRPGPPARWRPNLRGAICLTLPGLVLVGGALLLSHYYFGAVMPISGQAKLYYQSIRAPLHGGTLGTLWWHWHRLFDITTAPLADFVEATLGDAGTLTWRAWCTRTIFTALLVVGICTGARRLWVRRLQATRRPAPRHYFAAALIAFVLIHFGTYAVALSHFTEYGTWYFSPEIMAAWVCYAGAMAMLGRGITGWLRGRSRQVGAPAPSRAARLVLGATTVVMLLVGLRPVWRIGDAGFRPSVFYLAGRWLNEHVPAGSRIGAFSAGMLSYFASRQQVINLDGLMNDVTYLQDYLKPARVPEYVRARNVGYFSDYASAEGWRSGQYCGLNLREMQLLRWWPMEADLSYGVWKLLPDGRSADVLDPCTDDCDRLSQIQYAATVLGRFAVAGEDAAAALARPEHAGKRVFTSIVEPASLQLRHVLIPEDQIPQLGLTRGNLEISTPLHVVFGGAVELLGVDIPVRAVKRGERFVITRCWTLVKPDHGYGDVLFELWMNPANPYDYDAVPPERRILHKSRACYGTHPVCDWRVGEIVVETYSFDIPRGAAPGAYPVNLVLWDPSNRWLVPDAPGASASQPAYFVGNIEVR